MFGSHSRWAWKLDFCVDRYDLFNVSFLENAVYFDVPLDILSLDNIESANIIIRADYLFLLSLSFIPFRFS